MAADNHDLRNTALNIICGFTAEGRFLNVLLNECFEKNKEYSRKEKAFIKRLSEGTVEQLIFTDYVLSCFSKTPLKKIRPVVLNILRMSVYQLYFMDSVPDRAVCSEAVRIAKKRRFNNLSGFINGILRNISRKKDDIKLPDKDKETERYLSVKYSMPEWIVQRFLRDYGEDRTESILKWYINKTGITVRCNTSKAPAEEIIHKLESEGVGIERDSRFNEALKLSDTGAAGELKTFADGYIQVQDTASMIPGYVLALKPGDKVIDVCAAPGGKSLHAADRLKDTGMVISCDISEEKVSKIRENIMRSGFKNIKAVVQDATVKNKEFTGYADALIADLPCSGLGIIGKKPDIKYNASEDSVKELAAIQRKILSVVWEYVKPGGYMVYSTCTVTKEENSENYKWILDNLPFEPVSLKGRLPEDMPESAADTGSVQLLPGEYDTDGFYIALFRRKQEDN